MRLIEKSGEPKMYAMKPIVSLPEISHYIDGSMYEMKNINHRGKEGAGRVDHTQSKIVADVIEQVIEFFKNPLPEYAVLEARQEKILAQLAELRKQVSTLCDFLKHTNQTEKFIQSSQKETVPLIEKCTKQEAISVNLILNVNPKSPLYSIKALQKVWKDISINVQSYVHSSVDSIIPHDYKYNTNLFKDSGINLSLIWKEVEDCELISGLRSYPIKGEVNFLRYLSRLTCTYNYENCMDVVQAVAFNTILDLCYSIRFETTIKKQQYTLQKVGDQLGKDTWFGKNEPNIIDIAVWSTIKLLALQSFPLNLKKWMVMCDKVFQ